MKRWVWRVAIVPILLLAAILRLVGNDWDNYEHYHPDERYITWVATTIGFSFDLHPHTSPFNPYYWPPDAESTGIIVEQDQQRDFAYGHLPLYLAVSATRLFELLAPASLLDRAHPDLTLTRDNETQWLEFNLLTAVSRALTALLDVGTVWLVYRLGLRLYDHKVGLLAATFLALNVMHIQLAHFFTVDPYMTFFTSAALLSMVAALQAAGDESVKRWRWRLLVAAIAVGLAIGSKFSAILLLMPLALTTWWCGVQAGRMAMRRTAWIVVMGVIAMGAFVLTNPFAVIDWTCEAVTTEIPPGPVTIPQVNWRSCFVYNIGKQAGMVDGSADFAFTRQYHDTLPFLYYIEMQMRWGMGWLLGILAFVGLGWAVWRGVIHLNWSLIRSRAVPINQRWHIVRPAWRDDWVLLIWLIPFFLSTGTFFVKFMRYLQPMVPLLMVYGAAMLFAIRNQLIRRTLIVLTLLVTSLYALAFVNVYDQPHSWVRASQWIYANVADGSTIMTEQWGDRLPTTLVIDGEFQSARSNDYEQDVLTWLTYVDSLDTLSRLEANVEKLVSADYLVIDSNRVYGVVPRLPNRYPISSQFYPLLFDGSLGYQLVFTADRVPHLGNTYLQPDFFSWPELTPPTGVKDYYNQRSAFNGGRVDESFTLYDQSLVMIFENVEQISAEAMLRQFDIDN